MKSIDVAIVSAFGRGNWLASELADRGMSAQLIDVTENMGRWTPEDWEGPFGFLQADQLSQSQLSRLGEEDYHDNLTDGFTIWIKDGPIDMRGMLTQNWLDKLPAYAAAKTYINNFENLKPAELDEAQERLILSGFGRSWLVHFAHQFASPVFQQNALAINSGRPLPLFSPFFVRRVSRKGLQKSLEWCRSKGVEVVSSANVVDLAMDGKNCSGVQISGESSRVVVAKKYV